MYMITVTLIGYARRAFAKGRARAVVGRLSA
jgi:hypothetical protein